jgi:hypothetical protein
MVTMNRHQLIATVSVAAAVLITVIAIGAFHRPVFTIGKSSTAAPCPLYRFTAPLTLVLHAWLP